MSFFSSLVDNWSLSFRCDNFGCRIFFIQEVLKLKKTKYETPQFLLFRITEDLIRTSGEGGSTPGGSGNNGWDNDIGDWDTEM